MAVSSASLGDSRVSEPPPLNPQQDRRAVRWLQVWLEAGREGQVFTYTNPQALELGCGDLVQVRLRGQRHIGLVVELLNAPPLELSSRQLQPIESLHQSAAVDPGWQQLIEVVALLRLRVLQVVVATAV